MKMENEMETGVYGVYYWGYIGIMEKKMETTILSESSKGNMLRVFISKFTLVLINLHGRMLGVIHERILVFQGTLNPKPL